MKRWIPLLSVFLIVACSAKETPPATVEVVLPVVPQEDSEQDLTPESPQAEPSATVKISLPLAPQGDSGEGTPEPATAPSSQSVVNIPAVDGTILVGTLYTPENISPPWPGVLLLHMLGSDRSVWAEVAPAFTSGGYAVLTLDMRGHGETGGGLDWALAVDDLQRAWRYLADVPEVDEARTGVIGASIGGNLALTIGAIEPSIQTVVLLSPGLDYRGVTTEDKMTTYGERPVLLVASQEDSYAAQSSETLSELALGPSKLEVYQGAGHGTNMFRAETGLVQLLQDWLGLYLR